MSCLGNILWFVLGGWWSALVYIIIGVVFCITIIGIPIGKACFQYAKLMAFPFGKAIVKETFIKGKENVSAIRRFFGFIANLIWLPFGIVTFVGNIGLMLICCITIILIPVAVVLARSSKFLLWPVGAKVITKEEYQAILNANVMKKMNTEQVRVTNQTQTQTVVPTPAPTPIVTQTSTPVSIPTPEPASIPVSAPAPTPEVELTQVKAPVPTVAPTPSPTVAPTPATPSPSVAEKANEAAAVTAAALGDLANTCAEAGKKAGQTVIAYGEKAGQTVIAYGEKAGNAMKNYSQKGTDYLKSVHNAKVENAASRDTNLSWKVLFDTMEAIFYKNKIMAVLMSFVEWVFVLFIAIYLIGGVISGIIADDGFLTFVSNVIWKLSSGSLIFFIFGLLCMLKQNHKVAFGIFAFLDVISLFNIFASGFSNLFTMILHMLIFTVLVVLEFKVFLNTQEKDIMQ